MGFTKSNRYEIFSNRCAPIQVSYLGFAGTTVSCKFSEQANVSNSYSTCELSAYNKCSLQAKEYTLVELP